jgi:hypothetical protein
MAQTQFPTLALRGVDVFQHFRALQFALQQGTFGSIAIPGDKVLEIEETSDRLILWASNVGIFNPAHSSLDYRLRDNREIRSFTHRLLETLDDTVLKSPIFSLKIGNSDRLTFAPIQSMELYPGDECRLTYWRARMRIISAPLRELLMR